MIRVEIPFHLRTLARVSGEITVRIEGKPTIGSLLDAVEAAYPMLTGTIRDHGTLKRRPFLRYFTCESDWSLEPAETPLPDAVISGKEPFLIVGGIAGG